MRKLFVGTVVAVGMVVGGTATAGATTGPSESTEPVTITLSPEQVTNLCEKRLPKIERRTTRLVERITGGAEVRGSAEWLRARAAAEREAGRESSAQLLEERADRRAEKVDKLNQVKQWAADFRTEHCAGK